jgi:hypothetical protein
VRAALGRFGWLALLPLVLLVYSTSFRGFPAIEARHDVLADADAANFVLVVRDFGLTHRFGDEYARDPRTVADNAQKHKIHHVLYGAAGHGVYATLRAAGLAERTAVYAVNAVVGVVNLVLLFFLLRRFNPAGNPVFPFLLFHAAALSTWIFSSIPESWPFSATLLLGYLLLLQRRPLRPLAMAVVLGVVMLNNVLLGALGVLLAAGVWRQGVRGWRWVRTTAAAAAVTVASWAGGLTVLSAADPGFRPDHFVAYTIWFRQFAHVDLPPYAPYVWKSATTNLFVNSVVSNQPDPSVPQEALLATLTGSPLGAAATVAYLLIMGVAGWALLRRLRVRGVRGALADPAADLALWCVLMLAVTVGLYYRSGFLYSTVVVPVLALLLCRGLDLRVRWQRALLYAALALMLASNAQQVQTFREALAAQG